jgi:hypothetical protein
LGLFVRDSSSGVTLPTPNPGCDPLTRYQSAIAHGVFDLGSTQTDVGKNAVVKLLERPCGIPQIQLVSRAAREVRKISHTISERDGDIDCGTLQTGSHELSALPACPAHKLVG